MSVTIEIEDATVQELSAQARALGLSLDDFLRQLMRDVANSAPGPHCSIADPAAEFDAVLDEFFASEPDPLPPTTLTYSRDDIYYDHD